MITAIAQLHIEVLLIVQLAQRMTNTYQIRCNPAKKLAGTTRSSEPIDHLRLNTINPGMIA